MERINSILLVDDDEAVNFLNNIILSEMDCCKEIIIKNNVDDAIAYLMDPSNTTPDLIFLDINMPRKDGWCFLEEFDRDVPTARKSPICMLTTSVNPREKNRIQGNQNVIGFETKPLTEDIMMRVMGLISSEL